MSWERIFPVFLDTETEPIKPGSRPVFVAGAFKVGSKVEVFTKQEEFQLRLLRLITMGSGDRVPILVAHNLAFDLMAADLERCIQWYASFHRPCLCCTMLWDALQRLARTDCEGEPILRDLESVADEAKAGDEKVRLSFRRGQLTEEQRAYLVQDVHLTERAFLRLLKRDPGPNWDILTEHTLAAWALERLSLTGLPIDMEEVRSLQRRLQSQRRAAAKKLAAVGWYVPARTGARGGKYKAKLDEKKIRADIEAHLESHGVQPLRTETGRVEISKEVLQTINARYPHPSLEALLRYKEADKMLSTYISAWKEFYNPDTGRIHPTYFPLLHTGRTSCARPNLQNLPKRSGKVWIRRCFRPSSSAAVFVETDYRQLELACLAQILPGKLREMIRRGEDVHRYLGTIFYGKPAKEITKEERFLMKASNFGLPAGMGPRKFVTHCARQGLVITLDEAARLRDAWLRAFPEFRQWLAEQEPPELHGATRAKFLSPKQLVAVLRRLAQTPDAPSDLIKEVQRGRSSPRLERWLMRRRVQIKDWHGVWLERHPVSYTVYRNAQFQGLAARLTKRGLVQLTLAGYQICAYVHDSYLIQLEDVKEVDKIEEILAREARQLLPDVYDENTPTEQIVESTIYPNNWADE